MIRTLAFAPRGVRANGKLVCSSAFEPRSTIAPTRICAVAARVRERLAPHFGAAPAVEIFDPLVPEAAAWPVLFADATTFEFATDVPAKLIVRHDDGRRLVAAAFGESGAPSSGAISPIESRVLEALVREIATAFEPLLGPSRAPPRTPARLVAHRCYFEMRFAAPIDATLGVALEEPPNPTPAMLDPRVLADVEIECRASVTVGTHAAGELSCLRVGSVVRIDTKVGALATLKVGDQAVATGECGSRGESAAFLVRSLSRIGVFP